LLLLCGGFGCSVTGWTDLDDWSRIGGDAWRIDGNSAESGPYEDSAYLVSTEQYSNLRLTVEFWIEDDTNSGVFIRCADPETIDPVKCYEINIWDNHPNQDFRTGSIVTLVKPLAQVDTVGKLNLLAIEAVGDLIVATIDGVETARLRNGRSSSGYIALQHGGGGMLRFRNLGIEVL
jgi:hypothetical protein